MRLRNIPAAQSAVENHKYVINEPSACKGKWAEVFKNNNPIYIEIGMGKGKFITELAMNNPNFNYIGIERYSSVLYRALQKRDELKSEIQIQNLLYLCADAKDISDIFEENEVKGIYLNFSDPWPKERHAKRRLMSGFFLERYDQILSKEGRIEFKTDNTDLFAFALDEVKESKWKLEQFTYDLHRDEFMNEGNVMTEYEEKFSSKGNPICKLIAYRNS